jgi:arylsulfatase A-like enzyme
MPYDPPTISPERLTLGRLFQAQGYRTGYVGKWHLGLWHRAKREGRFHRHYTIVEDQIDFTKPIDGGPVDFGFDRFFGTAGCSSSDAPYCFIQDRHPVCIPTVQTPDEMNRHPGVYPGLMAPDWEQERVDTTLATEGVHFIRDHAKHYADRPFFLYFALSTPHIPWLPPKFIQGTSREGPRGDMNALADWCVGQIRDALENCGLLDNTLLIFTSDNGPHEGANGHRSTGRYRGIKNSPYEGGHRIPFVARWPGRIPAGSTADATISLTDLMATLAALLGVRLPEGAAEDSFNVLPAITASGQVEPRPCLLADTGGHVCERGHFSLRCGRWKLIENNAPNRAEPAFELFDLEEDPGEARDLANGEQRRVQSLRSLLNRARTSKGLRKLESCDADRM